MVDLIGRANWVDLFALILLIRISYSSSRMGIGKQILPLALLVLILSFTLETYTKVSAVFIDRYSMSASVCNFVSYFFIVSGLYMAYRFILKHASIGPKKDQAATGIEAAGGAVLGFVRAVIIIGIILTGFLVMPVKFVESGVKRSYSGLLFIGASLRVFSSVSNMVFRGRNTTAEDKLEELLFDKDYSVGIPTIKSKYKTLNK